MSGCNLKCIPFLGKPEVADQIEVTKKLVDLYDFIDRKNVAIWGWSYGGEWRLNSLNSYFNDVVT